MPELANDLWWTWNSQAREVFRKLDYPLWRQTAHNPVLMLRLISPELLEQRAQNEPFLRLYDIAIEALDAARATQDTWWHRRYADANGPIAYFSAEFALHQSLPIYAGGLGVLAGDHCKEASDLGIPLIGVGFMYPQGYFHQAVSPEGWQQEVYERLNWADAPVEPAIGTDGRPCVIAVPLGNRTVLVSVWQVRLGRVRLFLLDTDLEENAPWDRELSARLYGGDRETRIQQEIILGIGGVRVLKAMGIQPAAWHLNEGHAAFVVLQRIRDQIESGASFEAALDAVRKTTIFTTHTPVPAGHDAFPFSLVETHLSGAWGTLGAYRDAFLALGHYDNGSGPLFNMTALALRTANFVNGVSQLHGQVTRDMWGPIWPGVRERASSRARHHQRHPRPHVAVARDGGAPRRLPARGLARSRRRRRRCGRPSRAFPTSVCGRPGRRCAPISSRSCANARDSCGRRSTSRLPASSRPERSSTRAR